jgi:glutamate racemase
MDKSMTSHRPHVLVMDSGVGGLSVSAEIRRHLPNVAQSYLADDAFRPYGEKTEAAIRARLPDLLTPMVEMLRPDILVIACNTASTTALPAIRDVIDIPVVGVVPAIKPAAALSKTRTIAVLGTPGTVRRRYVDALIANHAADCRVRLKGSLALVTQAEAKLAGQAVDLDMIRAEVEPIFAGREGADVDAVVLACTHFPLIVDELRAVSRQSVAWIDSGEAIARRVESLLPKTSQGPALREDTAFSTGPNENAARRTTFKDFGFDRVVSLAV